MTRYFYNDGLAAAWMARHHDVTFDPPPYRIEQLDSRWFEDAFRESGIIDRSFHIHPDSLHLLSPQRGDVIRQGESLYAFSPNLVTMGGFQHDAQARIIERNGIPFIWPESEPA